MHKLIVTVPEVARGEKFTVATVEAKSGSEDLVFLVGPRAASFSVDRASHSRRVAEEANRSLIDHLS